MHLLITNRAPCGSYTSVVILAEKRTKSSARSDKSTRLYSVLVGDSRLSACCRWNYEIRPHTFAVLIALPLLSQALGFKFWSCEEHSLGNALCIVKATA